MTLSLTQHSPFWEIPAVLPAHAISSTMTPFRLWLNEKTSLCCHICLFALRYNQQPLAWDRMSLGLDRRGTLIPFEPVLSLLGMLAASLPEDEPGAIAVDIPYLVQRAQQGDREAVATLYRVHVRMIYRYMASRVPTANDAEDLTAEVFVRMVEALPNYQMTGAPFEAWLYRIASSRVSDFYRSKANRQNEELPDQLSADEESFEETLAEEENVDLLRRALRQLPDEHQTILILRFVERKSHEEVAMLLGRSVTAVKSAQHRALSRLTELLGGEHKARHYLRGQHE